jgi:hypothetical protein
MPLPSGTGFQPVNLPGAETQAKACATQTLATERSGGALRNQRCAHKSTSRSVAEASKGVRDVRTKEGGSMMADEILDPVGFESEAPPKPMAKRLNTLGGKTVGILDIGFPNGSVFLDRVEQVLKSRYGVAEFVRRAKPSPARPADDQVRKELIEACDAIVEGTSS